VTVVVVTSNMARATAPGNVPLKQTDSGLAKDSVANVSQLVTIHRGLLEDPVGELPPAVLAEVDTGLRLALAL